MKAYRDEIEETRKRVADWERDHAGKAIPLSAKTPHEDLHELIRKAVVIDKNNRTVTLLFDYEYQIELSRIKTPLALLRWVIHLMEKDWMKEDCVRQFVIAVCDAKGWKIWAGL